MANLTGSTVCLVTGQPAHIQKTPLANRLSRRAHTEALAVAAAHGVVLDDHPDTRYGPKRVYTNHRPSILQDYDLGRPMEIESIVRARSPSPAVPASTHRPWMPSNRSASRWRWPKVSTRPSPSPALGSLELTTIEETP